ncbi:phage tail protein [Pantoea stewartii subsp. stewartii DC283]|uniref:Phage tail protein n=2 Tax=Pantoea stewartii TaxID=66269 RepID=H3RCR9_PANSE|nr:tail fiber assembly protein [Pantoea stewartii]ARF50292.1 phage tail protein [Pantoea stewartii subsp. stewartii DC283]EHU00846.1 tail fiber assembly protein [Pantoea stewartii subsp. stewartii DC283]KAB0545402.1 tail fiber assembly protein [Pantoea stewartii subsp. stewartii]
MTFEMSDKAQTLKIYNLRPDTQEFIGRSDCYIPAHTGLPANCTLTPPPEIPAGSAAVYHAEQDKWSLVADHRGQTVYSIIDGSPQLITSLGDLPDGTVSTAPAERYMKWDGSAWVHDADAEKAAFQDKASAQRQSLLTAANVVTSDWRTELQLGVITDEDKAGLIKWMAYIKALKALDFSLVNDEGGYNAIAWPDKP